MTILFENKPSMTAPFLVEQVDRSRVGRRRITFFTLVFLLTMFRT